ncbi:MAG: M36 family metallopeptidase [Vicinamibacterales bacterium]
MHKSLASTLLLSGLLLSAPGYAQSSAYAPRRAQTFTGSVAQPLASASQDGVAAQVAAFLAQRGIFVSASSIVVDGSPVAAANNVRVYRLTQRIGALDVYGVSAKAAVSASGALVFLTANFVPSGSTAPAAAAVTEGQALNAALARLYPGERVSVGAARREQNSVVFARTAFFHDEPRVTHVAVPQADGSLARGLVVETWSEARNLLHQTLVSSGGTVLEVVSRTSSDSYNVFVEDPLKGAQTVVAGPGAGNTQSPAGWLAGAQLTTNIGGNNVRAYLDVDSNNRPDRGGTAVTSGNFLASANLAAEPSTVENRAVSVQNLFYLNNVIHDELFRLGFDESAGNFQETNFTGAGKASDSVNAEAQDGGGIDNANFATPTDGRNPRMQMYLWSGPGPTHLVQLTGATYGAAGAEFGPALTTTGVSGTVVLANDGTGTPSDGCEAITNVSGQIALIDRGTCNFVVKVANAQAAGAIAVIVANNTGTTEVFTMGGTDRKIRIPSVMIGQDPGAALRTLSSPAATVTLNPAPPPQIDGSVDSDIVFHEFGHGLTWRMIGGMSGPLAGAIGEGASDAVAMLMNGDDRIGEYSFVNPLGIRRAPYQNYPNTYADVNGGEVHNDGEIYAAVVWELMQQFGARLEDVKQYFVDGMNYTPATPAYEDMRDGMLQAVASGATPSDACLVWAAFAKYGVGEGASGTVNRDGTVSIVESFTVPAACQP